VWCGVVAVDKHVDESADYSVLTGTGSRFPRPNSSGMLSYIILFLICLID